MQNKIFKLKIKSLKHYYSWSYKFGLVLGMLRKKVGIPRLKRPGYVAVGCLLLVFVFIASLVMQPTASAKTMSLSSKDIMDGTIDYNQIKTGADNKSFSLQDGDIGQWSGGDGLQMPPTTVYGDTDLEYGPNNTLFMMTAMNGCRYMRYDFEIQKWNDLSLPPVGCGYGMNSVYDGSNKMYFFPGNNSNKFFYYDIADDNWVTLPDAPTTVGNGATAVYVSTGGNSAIYMMRGNSSSALWQFNIQSNSWASKTPFPTTSNVDQGMAMVWDKANTIYALSNFRGEFKKYSISGNTWTNLPTATNTSSREYSMVWVNGAIYNSATQIYAEQSHMTKFDPLSNSWSDLARPPVGQTRDFNLYTATDGSDYVYAMYGYWERPILYKYQVSTNVWQGNSRFLQDNSFSAWEPMYDGGQNIYYIGGQGYGSFDRIWKKDLSTGIVTQIGSQFGSNNGVFGTYSNNALYTFQYFGGNSFKKFDLASNDWLDLPNAPYNTEWGASIVDGGDGYLYATFGFRSDFFRFSESLGWQRQASLPRSIGEGGQLTRVGRSIYALAGANSPSLMKYNMDTNAWAYVADAPKGAVSHGGYLTSDSNRYLYAGLGSRTDPTNRLFYRYDTSNDTWKRMADLPQNTQVGARAFYQSTTSKVWVTQGAQYSNLWSWTASNNGYVNTGSWYSKALDLTQVQAWQSLNVTSSGSGTINSYTRTSDNGRIWSDWQQVGGSSITSPPKRYVQLKLTLSGDGTVSPTVSGITLNYDQEVNAPTLPSQFKAYDKKGGQDILSGVTYEFQHPYFEWNGANDGANGSGVAGYYVYFGTDSNADPATTGTYQTNSDYTVTTAMNAGSVYYLRMKVRDNLGNISDAATYFSYRYFYISPPGSVLATTQTDFSRGTNTDVNISSGGEMQLTRQNSGVWATGVMEMMPNNAYGPAMAVVGDFLYVVRGSDSLDFWRYDLATNTWSTMAGLPSTANLGSSLTWDKGNYLYALTGDSSNAFYRYNIQNNAWEILPNAPSFVQAGADMQYIGGNKLAIILAGSAELYIYDANTRTFTSKASPPLTINSSNTGSGMWYDGSDLVYVYFGPFDQWTVNRRSLAAYSISQDSWRSLSVPPLDSFYPERNLVGDGRGNLYVFGNDYVHNRSPQTMAMKYEIASDTWKTIPNSPAQVVRGSLASDGKRYIYIIPSIGNSRKIVRYDTWDEKFSPQDKVIPSWDRLPWDQQGSWNWQAGNSSSATYDGVNYIYAIGANEGTWSRFMKRSVTTGQTTYLSPPPEVRIGGSLAYSNNTLYYTSAGNNSKLYKFNQSNQGWERLTNAPGNIYRPGSQALLALKDGTLLAIAGNSNRIYKYTPDSGLGTWQTMAAAPASILNGAARYDGNDTVYVLRGNNTNSFYKYVISTNTWITVSSLPINANFGAAIVFNNGTLYATAGNNTTSMYLYNPLTDNWQLGPAAPEYFRYGADFLAVDNNYALVIAGQDSPDIWRFNFPGEGKAYKGVATHISQPISVDGMFDYAGIQAAVDTPGNTKVEFWTRSSADGNKWDEWMISDQVKKSPATQSVRIASKPQKFTQVKVIMYSYDNQSTPTVSDYALDYYFDVTPPSNPSVLNVFTDASRVTPVANNTWYNLPSPIFDWPDPGEAGGATDGPLGSNLKGYWVYLGADPTASPRTAGTFVTTTEYIPSLSTSGTYYLRLQAVDMTGNVDPNVFAPFIYKFDNTPPNNPALIVVTPSGFTGKNNFTFQWPNGFDGNSGIAEYCYSTGALSGPFAIETCQTGTELANVSAAYQSGANVFYLRTKDIAGNFSSNYTQVSYYYSTDPPTPVTNFRAVPPNSEQNLFAFTWDYPTMFAGDPDQLTYCYSVNTLPTPTNTTCTSNMFISAFKAATQQGTNTIYMVARDEAGSVNWNNYASANFIANTVSPGIPLNLVVTDTSDSATSRWSLTLTWDPPTFKGNGISQYVLERSEDSRVFKEIGRVSNTAYVDLTVAPDKTYYYRVKAADNVDNQGGASGIVAKNAQGTFATPPKLVSDPKPQPSFDQALIPWVTDRPSTSFVYYGTSPSQLTQSKGSLDLTTEHGVTITGLQPSTIYYYRVQSFDNNRSYELSSANSQLFTFRTTETARIFGVKSSDIGLDSAVVSWETSVPTMAKIEYGPTAQYGFTQQDATGYTGRHTFRLSNLESGATIHYRIVATTENGSRVTSDDYTLTTIARPRISNLRFQPVNDSNTIAVKVQWTTNVPTSSEVIYRGLGNKRETSQADLTNTHEVIIEDLASSTEYDFEIKGRDQYGNVASSGSQKWQSGIDTKEPTISNLSVSVSTMTAVGNSKAQMIVSWRTDEPTTTQIQYGLAANKNLDKKTPLDVEPTVDHVVVISNLELAQVYRIQPVSRDISGNTAYGVQLATVTPDIEQSPLDIVLKTLQRIFRF